MGNGRWSGKGAGKSAAITHEGRNAARRFLLPGTLFVLIIAGCFLLRSDLGRDARHGHANNQLAQLSSSPLTSFTSVNSALRPSSSQTSSLRPSSAGRPDARSILGQLPLIFEANQGQSDPAVKFMARGAGYGLFLDGSGATLTLRTARAPHSKPATEAIHMTLVRANQSAAIAGTQPLPGKSNYFIGNDPEQWYTDVAQFAGVQYTNVYPGIDLVFYGNQGHLEYDFKVAPGADAAQAELQFDGATKIELRDGDLVLAGSGGDVRLKAPRIYQSAGDHQQAVEGRFVLRAANRLGFEIGNYDRSRELVIDPLLEFSTYFGGSGSETSPSVAVDTSGNIYLVGSTAGSPEASFPLGAGVGNPVQTLIPSTLSLTTTSPDHIFITKINPTSTPLVVYETFLGGNGSDTSVGIGVDPGDNVFVVGNTTSTNFPTVAANRYQGGPEAGSTGPSHIFVSELSGLDGTGATLAYSSYLSGNGNDIASGMTIDSNQDVFLTGTTTSSDTSSGMGSFSDVFPATNLPAAFQGAPRASIQFFVTEVNTKVPGVASIAYSTYFGGATPANPVAVGGGIAVDSTGNIYFSGTTNFFNSGESALGSGGGQGTDFPIVNAYQPCLDTPPPVSLTYPLSCTAPATPFPTDAFIAKLNPQNAQTGTTQLLFSSYLGGTNADSSTGIALDSSNIYITGTTNSSDFVLPTGSGAFQECLNTPVNPTTGTCPAMTATANTDAYVARFSNPTESTTSGSGSGSATATAVALTYFSYLGGSLNDSGAAIAVDTASGALITGSTTSTDFPVTLPNTIQSAYGGDGDAFFAHIYTATVSGQNAVASFATYFGGSGLEHGTSIAIDANSNTYFAGDTTSTNLQTRNPVQAALNGPSDAFVVKLGTAADLCMTCVTPVISPANEVAWVGNAVTMTFQVSNQGPDLATNVVVSGTNAPYTSATAGSGTCSAPSNNSIACTIPSLQAGATVQVIFTVTPTQATSYSALVSVSSFNNTDPNTGNDTATVPFTAHNFSVSVNPTSETVTAGNTAVYTVSVTPGQGVFGAAISLTCGSAPVGATCNFSSSSITPNNTPASTALNLTTTARPINTASSPRRNPFYAFWLVLPGIALIGIGARSQRRRRRLISWLALLTLSLAGLVMLPACSTSRTPPTVSGTPSGNYTLTVTATSGTFSQSASFGLTVQ
jgi:hypothetical protein